jgi:dTDP-4-amino-4,6-dideoxygalactose transaminase
MPDTPIFVTKPSLPPLGEFIPYLEKIWETGVLSNGGSFHQELESQLCEYLGVRYISLFNNATIGLMVAIRALNLSGEIITTPYSFAATTQSIEWNGSKPVFIDVESESGNMDPEKIEAAITSSTSAILPVHVYGQPCNTRRIKEVADKHKLAIIYDAAHAFGVEKCGRSILNEGDLSVLSFHATKVFNTFEGGAIISNSVEMKEKIDILKNFGLQDEKTLQINGLNGKMSEVQAAMGLLQLKYVGEAIEKRKNLSCRYSEGLKDVAGLKILGSIDDVTSNYSYYPVFINGNCKQTRDEVHRALADEQVFARKYFYPALSDFSHYKPNAQRSGFDLTEAEKLSSEVLCLPIYPDLSTEDCDKIISILREVL